MNLEFIPQCSLILVGAFNTQIMRDPRWIKDYLFPKSQQEDLKVKMNLEMISDTVTSLIEIDGIKIEAEPGKLSIKPNESTEECFEAIKELVINLSNSLPHTPVRAYGINFSYNGKSTKPSILHKRAILKYLCQEEDTDKMEIQQTVQLDNCCMNFSLAESEISAKDFKLELGFNFHFSIPHPNNGMSLLRDSVIDGNIQKHAQLANEHVEKVLITLFPKR